MSDKEPFVATFDEGPLGLVIDANLLVVEVAESSQAAAAGIQPRTMRICRAGEESLQGKTYQEAIGCITGQARPLQLAFEAVDPELQSVAPGGAGATQAQPGSQPANWKLLQRFGRRASRAVRQAGKSLLQGVQDLERNTRHSIARMQGSGSDMGGAVFGVASDLEVSDLDFDHEELHRNRLVWRQWLEAAKARQAGAIEQAADLDAALVVTARAVTDQRAAWVRFDKALQGTLPKMQRDVANIAQLADSLAARLERITTEIEARREAAVGRELQREEERLRAGAEAHKLECQSILEGMRHQVKAAEQKAATERAAAEARAEEVERQYAALAGRATAGGRVGEGSSPVKARAVEGEDEERDSSDHDDDDDDDAEEEPGTGADEGEDEERDSSDHDDDDEAEEEQQGSGSSNASEAAGSDSSPAEQGGAAATAAVDSAATQSRLAEPASGPGVVDGEDDESDSDSEEEGSAAAAPPAPAVTAAEEEARADVKAIIRSFNQRKKKKGKAGGGKAKAGGRQQGK